MFLRFLEHKVFDDRAFYDRDVHENILSDPQSPLGQKLNKLVLFCVLISVMIIILETLPGLDSITLLHFFVIDFVVSCIFLLEYLYRFFRSKQKALFPFQAFNIIDLLSFAPFFISLVFPALASLNILKVLRLLRILRLFEFSKNSPIATGFIRTIQEYHKEYKAIFSIFLSILVIISSFAYFAESAVNPHFASIPHALWWGIVTMSTVGYGDVVPVTLMGKVLGIFLIVLGPILFAVVSSITILVFMDVAESYKITDTKICISCKSRNNEHANFCMNCGHQHFTDPDFDHHKQDRLGFIKKIFVSK